MAPAIRVRIVVLVLLLIGLGAQQFLHGRSRSHVYQANLAAIPLQLSDGQGTEAQLDDKIEDILQASQTLNRRYDLNGDPYWLFVGYFARQKFGSQIHSPRHCYPGSGWNILTTEESERLGSPSGELTIQRDKDRRVVLYQYLTRGGATTSEFRLKWELTMGALLGRPMDAAFIRYSTPLARHETEGEALDRLGRFAQNMQPAVLPALPF